MTTKLKIAPTFWDDQEWAMQHYAELVSRYSGQWVAVVGKSVISYGPDPDRVEAEASQKTGQPKERVALIYVEAGNQIF